MAAKRGYIDLSDNDSFNEWLEKYDLEDYDKFIIFEGRDGFYVADMSGQILNEDPFESYAHAQDNIYDLVALYIYDNYEYFGLDEAPDMTLPGERFEEE